MSKETGVFETITYSPPDKNALWKALIEFQKEMGPIFKDAKNPHFRSKYATLDAVRSASLPVLNKHGLIVTQPTKILEGARTALSTKIVHTLSGQEMVSEIEIPSSTNPQTVKTWITYMRRT